VSGVQASDSTRARAAAALDGLLEFRFGAPVDPVRRRGTSMNIAQLLPAALIDLMASTAASAFETVVKVISVTPGREIVNEPYESCGSNPAAGAPAQPGCRHADHYDVRVMYTVVYEYQGQRFSAKLPYDPGNELKVDVAVTPK